jgi:hypothetical protein
LEFPEAFALNSALQPEGGFDAIVGNPPFAGKNTIIDGSADGYIEWLKELHPESHGNSDLVAHFFRRAFNLIRPGGTFGLIATNTIAQGDTRTTGLSWIRSRGGTIYRAIKRLKWPGEAAVIVSVVHVIAGPFKGSVALDGRPVEKITAFLFHAGPDLDPEAMDSNDGMCFVGVQVHGIGFTFDDHETDRGSFPLSEATRLIAEDPSNGEIIKPLMGWEEIANSSTFSPSRMVMDFGERTEEEARKWPILMMMVESRVKPKRLLDNRAAYRNSWWLFAERRPELNRKKEQIHQVIACSAKATTHLCFALIPSNVVLTNATNVIIESDPGLFAILQSRVHETWARFLGSSMKDDLTYTSSSCFELFPFCKREEGDSGLSQSGSTYYEFRSELMKQNGEGLTAVYNRFHRPDERSPDILRLRSLHDQMDRAVLAAYGWQDLKVTPEFFSEYDEEEQEDERLPVRAVHKKYRYRWPDEIHDEVLARLLALNLERAALQRPPETIASGKQKRAKVNMESRTNEEPVLF